MPDSRSRNRKIPKHFGSSAGPVLAHELAAFREATVKRMKSLGLGVLAAGVCVIGTASTASAASVIYSASTTSLTNMTHQSSYTWQLDGINLGSNTITSAVITFNGFFNWTTASADPNNILWVDLLDTSTHGANNAIGTFTDNTNNGTLGLSDVSDCFREPTSGTNVSCVGASALVTSSTAQTYLGSSVNTADASVAGYGNPSGDTANNQTLIGGTGAFSTTPVTWNLNITNSTVLAALASYISNGGNIALGLDSDCHFGDTSITFQIYGNSTVQGTSAVPEPGTMLLVGSGLFAAYRRRRRTIV